MREDIARAWIADLRTDPPQIQSTLINSKGHCCLGRLCVVLGDDAASIEHQADEGYQHLQERSGMSKLGVQDAWRMNDIQNKSFAQIADYIEQNWETM